MTMTRTTTRRALTKPEPPLTHAQLRERLSTLIDDIAYIETVAEEDFIAPAMVEAFSHMREEAGFWYHCPPRRLRRRRRA